MTSVIVSPKYQIIIPKEVRDKLNIKPGQKLHLVEFGNKIEFHITKNIKEARGMLKGMDTKIEREENKNRT